MSKTIYKRKSVPCSKAKKQKISETLKGRKYPNSRLPKEVYDLVQNKEWLYNQRITLQKSKDKIGEELGTTGTFINKWLNYHNIPKVRYNESNSLVKIKLQDKKWLYEEYKIKNKTCQQIADELGHGCSKSLVSVWLNNHNIVADESNSYERKINKVSKEELEVVDYINSIYDGEIKQSVRSILKGKEIDIYVPEKNFAIEYNGLYTHSHKDKKYHLEKTEGCQKQNIFLFHIFSHQWQQKQEICKSMIHNKLGLNTNKIYARKCDIRNVDASEKNLFLNNNHIQGKDSSTIKLGLYYSDELVSLMTFGKSRYNKTTQWELIRFANKTFTSVIGGFNKLLSYFKRNFNSNIVSYADRCYSQGNIYENNGFDLVRKNPPSYHYVDKNCLNVFHRYSFQKSMLKDKLEMFNENLTEWENMVANGWRRYWDCGTLTFILN